MTQRSSMTSSPTTVKQPPPIVEILPMSRTKVTPASPQRKAPAPSPPSVITYSSKDENDGSPEKLHNSQVINTSSCSTLFTFFSRITLLTSSLSRPVYLHPPWYLSQPFSCTCFHLFFVIVANFTDPLDIFFFTVPLDIFSNSLTLLIYSFLPSLLIYSLIH